uniref:Uncharacterized protein n=1 Tax=Knipowitschia caucasica TaxID=637954 RepID=A0AAV2JVG3_KNICA
MEPGSGDGDRADFLRSCFLSVRLISKSTPPPLSLPSPSPLPPPPLSLLMSPHTQLQGKRQRSPHTPQQDLISEHNMRTMAIVGE